MADKRLATTLFLANCKAPRDNEKVRTKGKASGMAEMAKAMEKMSNWIWLVWGPLMRRLAR